MSKHGPSLESQIRDHAGALAGALGKYSDEMWATGPWFMTITLLARGLADKLEAGELDALLGDIMKTMYPAPTDHQPHLVPQHWERKPSA